MTTPNTRQSLRTFPAGDLDYINGAYGIGVKKGDRVTYTGSGGDEIGTILGSHPSATHYLWVLLDGDTYPVILHPTWKVKVHDAV